MDENADLLMNMNSGAFNGELIYAGKLSANPEWKFALHKHEDLHEVIYIEDGAGSYVIDGKAYTAQKGDVLVYNRGTLHQEQSDPDQPLSTYYFNFRFLPRLIHSAIGLFLPAGSLLSVPIITQVSCPC